MQVTLFGVPAIEHEPDFAEQAALLTAKIKSRRAELGLSERKLAELLGVSRSYVQLLLRGGESEEGRRQLRTAQSDLDVLWRLANALQVDVMYLVNHERDVEPNPVRAVSESGTLPRSQQLTAKERKPPT